MLKICVSAVLLLGAAAVVSPPAFAAPPIPQSPKASNIVPVQGWGERCHWLRERIHELEGRIYYASPWERPRLEHRLSELREEFRGTCRRGIEPRRLAFWLAARPPGTDFLPLPLTQERRITFCQVVVACRGLAWDYSA